MLVLSRRTGEQVVIADNITVRVVSISGGKVRLGITAPKGVSVHRQEIQDRLSGEEHFHQLPLPEGREWHGG